MHKVILVDDHYIVRQGLEFLLSTVDDLSVLKGFKDGATFLSYLKNNERPDIVLLDLVMPEMNGIEITEILKQQYPEIKVLVLTSYVDDEHVISAIDKGADGYEMKDVEPQKLIETIHKVLQGERIIHPQAKSVIKAVSKKPHYTNKLSKREKEVLKEMVKGKTNKENCKSIVCIRKDSKNTCESYF